MDQKTIILKYKRLRDIIEELRPLVVAFSGGTDSTLLLKAAKEVLGDDVLAVTALSEITPEHEAAHAARLADSFGAEHLYIKTHELDIPEFVKNPIDKCYICKKNRFEMLMELCRKKKFHSVADGENMDDKNDYRPGRLAACELGIRSPLREAGMTKEDIRFLSKELKLSTWNKPASACLASRIPYHQEITVKKLKQIDKGEAFLRNLGLSHQIRLRHEGNTARIEVDARDIVKFTEDEIRKKIIRYFKKMEFKFITLDLEGYSTGSLNRAINQ